MAENIEKLVAQAMLKRGSDKAEAAVVSLGKLLRKKGADREALFETLRQIALEAPQTFPRLRAWDEISRSITVEDQKWVQYLKKTGMNNAEAIDYALEGLLRVLGQEYYHELVDIISSKKSPARTRVVCLEMLSEHCKRKFDSGIMVIDPDRVTEEMYQLDKLQAWAKAGFPPPGPIVIPKVELKKLGIELPAPYEKFLSKHEGDQEYETDEGQWRLFSAAELLEEVQVDRQKKPAICQLAAFADTLKKVLDSESTVDDNEKPYPLNRLSQGWAIGTESSGDILYLDPTAKHSVWIFHHDGGDVEQVAKTFGGWLRCAEEC